MSRATAFVLPEHLKLSVGGTSLEIRHDGDVVLEQTLGRRLGRIEATGDVTLRAARFTGAIRAGGTLRVESEVDAEELRGEVVDLGAVRVRARVIVATRRVVVGAAELAVDVIVAPEVQLDPGASGRVRVIDCLNERPPTRVRGCLSLDDYEADFGNVAAFLASRAVEPVSPLPDPRDEVLDETAEHPALHPHDDTSPTTPDDTWDEDDATDQVPLSPHDEDEDGDERAPAPPDGRPPAEPVVARPARPSRAVRQVEKAWERLQGAYAADPPPAISVIEQLLREGRADEVVAQVDDLWVALLRTHLLRRTSPPRTVTLAFHGIRAAAEAGEHGS